LLRDMGRSSAAPPGGADSPSAAPAHMSRRWASGALDDGEWMPAEDARFLVEFFAAHKKAAGEKTKKAVEGETKKAEDAKKAVEAEAARRAEEARKADEAKMALVRLAARWA